MAKRTKSVTDSFDRAAADYDRYAHIQRRAAVNLSRRIVEDSSGRTIQRALEIGCGTGLLTERLMDPYRIADWTITDIAPRMVAQCRLRIRDIESRERLVGPPNGNAERCGKRDFRVMDGRSITVAGQFDLICSNLAFQWFSDLIPIVRTTVDRLIPGGSLVFNTLGAESFSYWRALDAQAGGAPSAPVFPTFDTLADELFEGCCRHSKNEFEIEAETETLDDQHPSFLDFLHTLKTIGAGTPMGDRPVSVSQLRNVLRQSSQHDHTRKSQGMSIDYQVVTVIIRRLAV